MKSRVAFALPFHVVLSDDDPNDRCYAVDWACLPGGEPRGLSKDAMTMAAFRAAQQAFIKAQFSLHSGK